MEEWFTGVAVPVMLAHGEEREADELLLTGTVIAPAAVLTCRHEVEDVPEKERSGKIYVSINGGRHHPSQVLLSSDRDLDLCLLLFDDELPGARPLPLLRMSGLDGFPLEAAGYVDEDKPVRYRNLEYILPADQGSLFEFQVEGGLKHRSSGGPIVARVGEKLYFIGIAYLGGDFSSKSRIHAVAAIETFCADVNLPIGAVEFASIQSDELKIALQAETDRVLNDASIRMRREIATWEVLDTLFVPVRVAQGLRLKLSQADYEELERQHREGQHQNSEQPSWLRRTFAVQGRTDLREELVQLHLQRRTLGWEHLRAGIERAVVLGDPGFGKTMLLWHEVGRRNQGWLEKLQDSKQRLEQSEIAVFVHALELADWIKGGQSVSEAIIAHRKRDWQNNQGQPISDATVQSLKVKLETGAGLIAVDALDEVPSNTRKQLNLALGEFVRTCPRARLLLSSRLVGYTQAPLSIADENQLEVLAFDSRQMEQSVKAWFAPDSVAGSEAWRHMLSQKSIFGDLRCPLLLRLVCGLIEDARFSRVARLPHWETRCEVYESFLVDGVTRWNNVADPGIEASELFLDFAGDVALELWKQDSHRTLWGRREVARVVNAVRKGYRALDLRSDLVTDLCTSGILSFAGPYDPKTPLLFTHRSFGEYLVARSLAQKLKRSDSAKWLVDRKAWDTDWEQVILFLAGSLSDRPMELKAVLAMLVNPSADDVVCHRLSLAAKCLGELSAEVLQALGHEATTIINRAFLWWWKARTMGMESALPALAAADSKMHGSLLTQMAKSFGWEYGPSITDGAVKALAVMGAAAGTNDVLTMLVHLLSDLFSGVRMRAAFALGEIGEPACRDDVLEALANQLSISGLRGVAAAALGKIGPAAAKEDIVRRLRQLLYQGWRSYVSEEDGLPRTVAEALTRMQQVVAGPDILDGLINSLSNDASASGAERRQAILQSLRRVSTETKCSEGLGMMAELLREPDHQTVCYAAHILGNIGAAACRKDILDELAKWLQGENSTVVWYVTAALGKMGEAAGRKDILDELLKLLRDPGDVSHVVDALGAMGATAYRKEILDRLGKLLRSCNDMAVWPVAQVLHEIRQAPFGYRFVDELSKVLGDSEDCEPKSVAEALTKMGVAPCIEDALEYVVKLMDRRKAGVVWSVVKALGKIGAPACRDDILDELSKLMGGPDWLTSTSILELLGKLGAPACRKAILDESLKLLPHDDIKVVRAVVEMLGEFGPAAGRADIIDALLKEFMGPSFWQTSVIETLGRLGAVRDDVLDRLLEWIGPPYHQLDNRHSPFGCVAEALGAMGAAAARDDVVVRLLEELRELESSSANDVSAAIIKMANITALERLKTDPELWSDPDQEWSNLSVTIRAFERMGAGLEGIRIFLEGPGHATIFSAAALAMGYRGAARTLTWTSA